MVSDPLLQLGDIGSNGSSVGASGAVSLTGHLQSQSGFLLAARVAALLAAP